MVWPQVYMLAASFVSGAEALESQEWFIGLSPLCKIQRAVQIVKYNMVPSMTWHLHHK